MSEAKKPYRSDPQAPGNLVTGYFLTSARAKWGVWGGAAAHDPHLEESGVAEWAS